MCTDRAYMLDIVDRQESKHAFVMEAERQVGCDVHVLTWNIFSCCLNYD